MSKPGRKIVSKGILVIQNITKLDAGEGTICVEKYKYGGFKYFKLHFNRQKLQLFVEHFLKVSKFGNAESIPAYL